MIKLLSKSNEYIKDIDYWRAVKLLKNGQALLVIDLTPTVKLVHDTISNSNKRICKDGLCALKASFYHNYRVNDINGKLLFKANNGKILWYLNKSLIDVISIDPPLFQLKFKAKVDVTCDDYHLQDFDDRCVVCGNRTHLTRHHVVPKQFRRYMDNEYRFGNIHDVLLVCTNCHRQYENLSKTFKVDIYAKYGLSKYYVDMHFLKSRAHQILYNTFADPKRIDYFKHRVDDICKKYGIKYKTLQELTNYNYLPIGKIIIPQVNQYEFCMLWREHFVAKTNPKFLPLHWTINYRAVNMTKKTKDQIYEPDVAGIKKPTKKSVGLVVNDLVDELYQKMHGQGNIGFVMQYIRRGQSRRKVGVLVAVKSTNGKVCIGYSKCKLKADIFNPEFGLELAVQRAGFGLMDNYQHKDIREEVSKMPHSIVAEVNKFITRCFKYFKTDNIFVFRRNNQMIQEVIGEFEASKSQNGAIAS